MTNTPTNNQDVELAKELRDLHQSCHDDEHTLDLDLYLTHEHFWDDLATLIHEKQVEAEIALVEGLIDAQDQEVDLDGRPTSGPYHIICGNDCEYLEYVLLPALKRQLSTPKEQDKQEK